jgi:hypothetical protein
MNARDLAEQVTEVLPYGKMQDKDIILAILPILKDALTQVQAEARLEEAKWWNLACGVECNGCAMTNGMGNKRIIALAWSKHPGPASVPERGRKDT